MSQYDYPEDEVERQLRAFREWLVLKFRQASFAEIAGLVLTIVLIVLGVIGACIYYGELREMRHTNELTQTAIETAQQANNFTMSLIKSQQQAILDLTIPSNPDSLSQIAAGLSAQFTNKGKVDARNFNATATFQKLALPNFRPIGNLRTVTVAMPRILPLEKGFNGSESVATTTFDLSDLGEADFSSVKNQTITFKMVISYSYDNGFKDTMTNKRCFMYLYIPAQPPSNQAFNSWDECGMAMNVYRSYFRHK